MKELKTNNFFDAITSMFSSVLSNVMSVTSHFLVSCGFEVIKVQ